MHVCSTEAPAALCAIITYVFLFFFPSPFHQLDTEYRKKWDSLVIKLEVVDREANSGSEVVHWATQFPVSSLLFPE